MNLGGSFGVSFDDTQEDGVEDRMKYLVRAVAIIGILLFALPLTSAGAADWRFSQATAQPAQSVEDQ
ncbi:MAG TPA: hypothetical protein VFK91_05050, partial [Methyloceanibacter sp.]|nr:hypothetical protein [Methyloceanibacter sp.]